MTVVTTNAPGRAVDRAGASRSLDVRLLGPMEVDLHGRPLALTTGRLRAVLAVLAMSAGRTVPIERLAGDIWSADLPVNERRSLQTYVTRLRRMLGSAAIDTQPAGYALTIDAEQVDALRFVRRVDEASRELDPTLRAALLDEAFGLWRGSPFGGVSAGWLMQTESRRLNEHYLAAIELRADLGIASGRCHGLVAELSNLAMQHSLRESLWARLIVALARSGRYAEALKWYERIRTQIAEDLGQNPGPELQQIYADLLAGRRPQVGPGGR
jgi:DNA-binding SARP family transcriptional activator